MSCCKMASASTSDTGLPFSDNNLLHPLSQNSPDCAKMAMAPSSRSIQPHYPKHSWKVSCLGTRKAHLQEPWNGRLVALSRLQDPQESREPQSGFLVGGGLVGFRLENLFPKTAHLLLARTFPAGVVGKLSAAARSGAQFAVLFGTLPI
jgi:hypothetical protein